MKIVGKVSTEVEVSDEEAKELTKAYLYKRFGFGHYEKYKAVCIHEGQVGKWYSIYHNDTEFRPIRPATGQDEFILNLIKEL